MESAAPWQPLLRDDDAAHAWRAIDRIAAALVAHAPADAALSDGAAGRALFFAYLDRARPDAAHAAQAEAELDAAFEGVAALAARPDLYGGFTGVAWAVDHLLSAQDDDPNEELDERLLELCDGWTGDFDLVGGLCGFGVYALQRRQRPSGRAILERVVAQLAAQATPSDGDGRRWRTRPEWMIPPTRAANPNGYYDLGVAHGVGAVALVLGGAAEIVGEPARTLCRGALRDWLRPRLPADAASFWPSFDGESHAARAAWCYGDPGAAVALLATARALDDHALADRALAIARRAAARDDGGGVRDAGLCHGSAGLALLFHRLHHDSPDPLFAAAAERWYRATLAFARDDARGGFWAYAPAPDGSDRYEDDLGLVGGAVGIGLALLAAVTPVAPDWSSVLAMSLPR